MDSRLTGKTVVVTGASGGIGREIVRSFIGEGASVAIHYHRNQESADALAAECTTESAADRTTVVAADLRDEAAVVNLFEQTKQHLGVPNVLIANAGAWPIPHMSIDEMTLEQWNNTVSVNMTSVFLCVREFLKLTKASGQQDPAIVMIGSTAGHFGEAGHADYAASKGAFMTGLMNSLKNEITRFARHGRINTVCPGWTLTPMADRLTGNRDAMERALQTIALRKFGAPKDIANAVTFLASNQLAGHITGQSLFVSGGMEGRVVNLPDEVSIEEAGL